MELIKKEGENLGLEIPNELKNLFDISKNMEGVVPRLPQIEIAHKVQMFVMPGDEKLTEFEAVILDQNRANAWWEENISESGGGSVPDCFSLDGIVPTENCEKKQNENCADCNWNQFGSDRKGSGGKDCKNMKRLHLIMEGSTLPRRLTVPPTSIRSFDLYMTELVDRGLPYACVVSKFSLAKKINKTFEYSEVKFEKIRVLNKEELFEVANYIKTYREQARKQDITSDEYMPEDNEENVNQNMNQEEPPQIKEDYIPF